MKLEYLSASEIGREVNKGTIKPTEVVAYFMDLICKYNKDINAFTYTKFNEAMEVAKKQDELLAKGNNLGPFAGVPFALKDFLPNKPGWTSSHGGVKCLISIDEEYSTFCKAVEDAGGIALGKTNAPAYGFRGTTDNKLYGVTKNPFNKEYNPGGSSGGSAAAVSSGLIPIAEGGDAGGSIRIPAGFCGLFGFKAGVGTIPMVNRGDAYSATHPFCTNGGLTKTVEDAAILLNYLAKYDPRDPNSVPQNVDYLKEMKKDISNFKIAYTFDFDLFPVEEAVIEKMKESINKVKSLGIEVEEVHFNFKHTLKEMSDAWCKGITIDPAIDLNNLKIKGIDLLKEHEDEFPKEFIYWKNECDKMGIMDLYEFNIIRSEILDEFERVFSKFDLILSPVSCVSSIKNSNDNDTKGPSLINGKEVDPLIGWAETFLVNFVGYPAASIPSGQFENNIPFGLHIISKKFHEGDIFAFSSKFEEKYPWRNTYAYYINK